MSFEVKHIEKYIDHTYLKADATTKDIDKLCEEAKTHGFYSVCVNGAWAGHCAKSLAGTGVKVAAVVGFPLGAMASEAKAFEAELAAKAGAEEIDMVLAVGWLLEGRYDDVRADIRAVVEAVKGRAAVKVIFETGFLTAEQIKIACVLSEEAGAHFVKTSTGFGPGGATVEHIELMRASVSPSVGVKASGGVRDYDAAVKMIVAGANRLGTSSGVAIVTGSASSGTY
ncbi:deoxyribose-phosphate aldolase [Paenibacillus sp.]|uniref:deoxyribose-phosphate aldolase n=1 Tax=Paenibacillus sp. TaxID=58172 RepID=UPI002D40EDBD|nr:deoxyribose-phosphate aldolase [Paenibacillus sp.]HZG57394.1 deoxyribose-phosphate aldolase [Paenibacillus sp.]